MLTPLPCLVLGAGLLMAATANAQVRTPAVGSFRFIDQLNDKSKIVEARTLKITSPATQSSRYILASETPGFTPTQTLNFGGGSNNGLEIQDPNHDNVWLTSEMQAQDLRWRGALDAHWGLQKTLEYWQNVHGWRSFDNQGTPVVNRVNFHNPSLDENGVEMEQNANAYWNRGSVDGYPAGYVGIITFENGSPGIRETIRKRPATDLATVGHEFGHGVNFGAALLCIDGRESGPLNEGFADIWGACVSNFAGADFPIWQGPRNPTSTISTLPRYYQGQGWNPTYTPMPGTNATTNYNHTNGAVLYYWFYLISAGKTDTNEKGVAYCVPKLGIATTERIAFETLKRLRTSTCTDATYLDVYNKSLAATTALYGSGSKELRAVQEAWYAVGVGPLRPAAYTIAAPVWNCNTTSGTFTLTAPGAAGIASPIANWAISPAGVVNSTPTQGVSQITLTSIAGRGGIITITATNSCGGVIQTSLQLMVGNPAPTGIYGEHNAPPGRVRAYITPVPNALSYNWRINNVQQNTTSTSVTFRQAYRGSCQDAEVVEVQAVFGNCGTSQWVRQDFFPTNCQSRSAVSTPTAEGIYPNPTNEYVMVNTEEPRELKKISTLDSNTAPVVQLYNAHGKQVYYLRHVPAGTFRLETSGFPNGLYTLRVTTNGRTTQQQLRIQH